VSLVIRPVSSQEKGPIPGAVTRGPGGLAIAVTGGRGASGRARARPLSRSHAGAAAKESMLGAAHMAKRHVGLEWEGKSAGLGVLDGPTKRLEVEEELDDPVHSNRARIGRMVHGDAIDVARALAEQGLEERVDLIYLDPPYLSGV